MLKEPMKLNYKDFMIVLRFSIFRLIELYGENAIIEIYVDDNTGQIISVIIAPRGLNTYHKIEISLIRLLVYTIKYTNRDIDERMIAIRIYRIIRKQSIDEVAKLLNISKDNYNALEIGYNPNYLNKMESVLAKTLNIDFEEFKGIRL